MFQRLVQFKQKALPWQKVHAIVRENAHPVTISKLEYHLFFLVQILGRIYCVHKDCNTAPGFSSAIHQKLSCESYRNHWLFYSSFCL